MEDKKSYLQKLANQLQQWDAEINELKMKADKVKTESRSELLNQIDEIREGKAKTTSSRKGWIIGVSDWLLRKKLEGNQGCIFKGFCKVQIANKIPSATFA
jgi:hypothetical protein